MDVKLEVEPEMKPEVELDEEPQVELKMNNCLWNLDSFIELLELKNSHSIFEFQSYVKIQHKIKSLGQVFGLSIRKHVVRRSSVSEYSHRALCETPCSVTTLKPKTRLEKNRGIQL